MGLEWPQDCSSNSEELEKFFNDLTHRYMNQHDPLEYDPPEGDNEDDDANPKRAHGNEARAR